jgi:quinone-modifying oxidoreductase subunit QmoC
LHGRKTTVLRDRSFDFDVPNKDGPLSKRYRRDMQSLQACLQCGACTATCDLASDESLFPRHQLTFVRLGLEDRAASGTEIWKCYACADCTAKCPSGAKPAGIMRGLRQLAIERYGYPGPVARAVNEPRGLLAVYAVVAVALAGLVALGGSFSPGPGPLDYAGMLPDKVLVPVFSCLTFLPLTAVVVGASRAWASWYAEPLRAVRPGQLWRAVRKAAPEIVAQRKLSQCEGRVLRPWAHRAIIAAFAGLLLLSAVMTVLLAMGRYPLPMGNPLKILANVFAGLLIGGTLCFFWIRIADAKRGERASFFDWAFLWSVLLAGLTGVATEVVRTAGARGAAYPVYFVHLVVVLGLMLTLPYTKLAHAVYRVLALAGEQLREGPAQEEASGGRGAAGTGPGALEAVAEPPKAVAGRLSAEDFLAMSHSELSTRSNAEIAGAYYELRDRSELRAKGRYYPNMKRLVGSALEREKDRREIDALVNRSSPKTEWEAWYEEAAEQPCTWWLENHMVARHALTTCLNCGMCTSVCPAAEHFEEYDPRVIVDTALSGDEDRIVSLLKSDIIWYCAQCGSCNSRCPHNNDIMNLVGSLRTLAQLKGYHTHSVRGRQQYAGRHLWSANLWNRAVSLYFRNPDAAAHPDFGPRYAELWARIEDELARVGGTPDMDGTFAGRKVTPETLAELRSCIRAGGALFLWQKIEEHAAADAARLGLDIDEYLKKVSAEG